MSIADDILAATAAVTKGWTRRHRAEKRAEKRTSRSVRRFLSSCSDQVNCTDVADEILPAAYERASKGGTYPLAMRQLYYECREQFLSMTDRELDYKYFCRLLRQYQNRNPEKTSTWRITAEPRGTFIIPNTERDGQWPCGTSSIDAYLGKAAHQPMGSFFGTQVDERWKSLAPGQRYQAVLYIEKEGFGPLFQQEQIAERFDLAILSCKGQSVVAARKLVDHVCRVDGGVPLFVLHDFDKAGFEISQRLTSVSEWARENDSVAYEFKNKINVTDLGLRLEDVLKYDLQSESCKFTGGFADDSICTNDEKEFLRSDRRVELNAFNPERFIEWVTAKLTEHGLGNRLIPDDDILERAYRRALAIASFNSEVDRIAAEARTMAKGATIPKELKSKLRAEMKKRGGAWDQALYDLAEEHLQAEGAQ